MSGGHFNYNQSRILEIIEKLEILIAQNGKKKTNLSDDDRRSCKEYPEFAHEYEFHYSYPKEVIKEFKKGLEMLKKAYIYAQRIDWLVSCDDGEEQFLERLKEDLNNIKK